MEVNDLIEVSKRVANASARLKEINLQMNGLRKQECSARNELNVAIADFEKVNQAFLDDSDPERGRKSFAVKSA